ncbi:MAG TPA: DUF1697 domain-containing protein [Candidatus Elarobacter sp.]
MSVHVALIRGINVGGHAMVAMADVRAFFGALGFRDARTLLQSGNVVFAGAARTDAALEARLEKEATMRLGLRTSFLVRSAAEWADVVARNPFPNEAQHDPGHLHVMFLKSAPAAPAVEALQAAVTGPEVVRAGARHLYITYPDGSGRSKLTGALIEKKLGTTGTARNWNTVLKLAALAGDENP